LSQTVCVPNTIVVHFFLSFEMVF